MKTSILLFILFLFTQDIFSQNQKWTSFFHPSPANYEVEHALEIESLFPMYFYGGFHLGAGYRYKRFRVRVSVINGGDYNADNQAVNAERDGYERYYTTSPGVFLGYNVWKNLELYGYYEHHTFEVEQMSTEETKDILSHDLGIGISYQFFLGRQVYIQPGVHSYFRKDKSVSFSDNSAYTIPQVELTPIVRIGFRLFSKFEG